MIDVPAGVLGIRLRPRGSRTVHAVEVAGPWLWTLCGQPAADRDRLKAPNTRVTCPRCNQEESER